ncbi:MAG: LON peptidase substrate-binding domain-containing protein, partial [Bacteroidota bacterium]
SKQEEDESNKLEVPAELAVLTMRNTVLYPGVIFPITVGRDKSIRLIKDANKRDKIIAVVAQKNPSVEDPSIDDLYNVGTLAQIVRMMRMPDGSSTVILQGKRRIKIDEYTQTEPYFRAKVSSLPDLSAKESKEYKATIDSIRDISHKIINLSPQIPSEASVALRNIDSKTFLIHFVSSNLNISQSEKQTLLETLEPAVRATIVLTHVTQELQLLELKDQIQSKVRTDMDKQQKEYFLQQQIRAIQEELGGDSPDKE